MMHPLHSKPKTQNPIRGTCPVRFRSKCSQDISQKKEFLTKGVGPDEPEAQAQDPLSLSMFVPNAPKTLKP